MIDLTLSDDQVHLREVAKRVAEEVYAPRAAEWDAARQPLPHDERRRLADLGFLGICLPEEHGGSGAPLLDALLVIEELGKQSLGAAFAVFEANTGPARVIDLLGTPQQRARFLPPIVRGDATMALAISEPEAGSAATDLRTSAEREGDDLVLNGTKRWSSGAGEAELSLVYARIDNRPGASGVGAVVVERDAPGLSYGSRERLMGFRPIPSADMVFEDVRVPVDNLIVDAGGFSQLFGVFSIERLGNATMSLANSQACVDRTAAYVQERHQFGRPLVEFQTVHTALADMLMQTEAARLLIWRAAAGAGCGVPDPLEASVAKCFSNEVARRVTATAIELHGGYGYSEEYGIERCHRDAHGWAIAGGTPTMQRVRIASAFLGRRFSQRAGDP